MIAWERTDTKHHLCCSRMKYSTFNYGRIQYWTTSSPLWCYCGDDDSDIKVFLSNHHSFQMLEEDLLPMTRPMMAVATSEQRILSWIIGIRYIEVLILSELDNRRDRWGWWAQCEYQRRIRGLMAGPQTMAKDLSDPVKKDPANIRILSNPWWWSTFRARWFEVARNCWIVETSIPSWYLLL